MRRHIVWPLGLMRVARLVLRRDALEKGGKVPLHVRIGVFLNQERGGGVPAEQRQQAGRDRFPAYEGGDVAGDLDEALASRLDAQLMQRLAHFQHDPEALPTSLINSCAITRKERVTDTMTLDRIRPKSRT